MKLDPTNDPILRMQSEENDKHRAQVQDLESAKAQRKIAQGLHELGKQHSFRQLIEKLEELEGKAIERMVGCGSPDTFHFERGWVCGIRLSLHLIRDPETLIRQLDTKIGQLKNAIGSSRLLDGEQT